MGYSRKIYNYQNERQSFEKLLDQINPTSRSNIYTWGCAYGLDHREMFVYGARMSGWKYKKIGEAMGFTDNRAAQLLNRVRRKINGRMGMVERKDFVIEGLNKQVDYLKRELITAKINVDEDSAVRCDSFDFSMRTANCLKNEGIFYIEQLCDRSSEELIRIPNMGRKSVNEIKLQLQLMGLQLRKGNRK